MWWGPGHWDLVYHDSLSAGRWPRSVNVEIGSCGFAVPIATSSRRAKTSI